MNVHDSEKMIGLLCENGYSKTENPVNADLIIFNTCAIREKAEQKFYSQLGRTKTLKKKNKELKIAVAGCVAQDGKKKIFAHQGQGHAAGDQDGFLMHALTVWRSGRPLGQLVLY